MKIPTNMNAAPKATIDTGPLNRKKDTKGSKRHMMKVDPVAARSTAEPS